MAVRSKRAINPDRFGPTRELVYVVPANETFRGWIWLSNDQATNRDVSILVNGTDDANLVWRGLCIANDSRNILNLVFNPGDEIYVGTASGEVHVNIMGSELEGSAD